MSIFKRSSEFSLFKERFSDQITLSPGESQDARFQTWLASLLVPPCFCRSHPSTQLIPDNTECKVSPVYNGDWSDYHRFGGAVPELVPNLFDFNARLRCPACRCARALCPPEFHTTSFETFDTSTPERATTLAIAREFAAQVNNRGCGFALFVGTTGPGKTRLACNIVQALDNGDSLYVRHGELTAALRATYRNNVEYDDEGERIELENPLEVTRGVRFLVLDEIGCTALANDERILLDELLKHRYDQNKPTILISNLPLDQFKEFVGDALHDRIRHAAGNGKFFVQFKGESYRRNMSDSYLEGRA